MAELRNHNCYEIINFDESAGSCFSDGKLPFIWWNIVDDEDSVVVLLCVVHHGVDTGTNAFAALVFIGILSLENHQNNVKLNFIEIDEKLTSTSTENWMQRSASNPASLRNISFQFLILESRNN